MHILYIGYYSDIWQQCQAIVNVRLQWEQEIFIVSAFAPTCCASRVVAHTGRQSVSCAQKLQPPPGRWNSSCGELSFLCCPCKVNVELGSLTVTWHNLNQYRSAWGRRAEILSSRTFALTILLMPLLLSEGENSLNISFPPAVEPSSFWKSCFVHCVRGFSWWNLNPESWWESWRELCTFPWPTWIHHSSTDPQRTMTSKDKIFYDFNYGREFSNEHYSCG